MFSTKAVRRFLQSAGELLRDRLREPLDLEWVTGWADGLWIVAGAVLVHGIWRWNHPAAEVVAAVEIAVLAYFLAVVSPVGKK